MNKTKLKHLFEKHQDVICNYAFKIIICVVIISVLGLISYAAKGINQRVVSEDDCKSTTAAFTFNEPKATTQELTNGQVHEQSEPEQEVPEDPIVITPESSVTIDDEIIKTPSSAPPQTPSSTPPTHPSTSSPELIAPTPTTIPLGKFRLTAYCPCEKCCYEWAQNRPIDKNGNVIVYTASGEKAVEGLTIAADTNVLPFGTRVYINGHEYEVHDRGVKGNSIDIYFESHEDAVNFGLQYADVSILS